MYFFQKHVTIYFIKRNPNLSKGVSQKMNLEYQIEDENKTINNILQNELKISSRLLYKLINMQKIYKMSGY